MYLRTDGETWDEFLARVRAKKGPQGDNTLLWSDKDSIAYVGKTATGEDIHVGINRGECTFWRNTQPEGVAQMLDDYVLGDNRGDY